MGNVGSVGIQISSNNGSVSVPSANVGKQKFTATAGMTGIIVTDFTLNEFNVFIDGSLTTYGYTTSSQTITFVNQFNGGEEILVVGIK